MKSKPKKKNALCMHENSDLHKRRNAIALALAKIPRFYLTFFPRLIDSSSFYYVEL